MLLSLQVVVAETAATAVAAEEETAVGDGAAEAVAVVPTGAVPLASEVSFRVTSTFVIFINFNL